MAASKRKTVTTQAEEISVTVSRGFDTREQLMCRMGATMIAFRTMLVGLRHRHP